MARVALISIHDRNAYGLRLMSAQLRDAGHEPHIIFLNRCDTNPTYELESEVGEYPWMGVSKRGRVFKYASNTPIRERELELLRDLVEEIRPDIIGATVNTPLRVQSTKVARYLKRHFDIPLIWGGFDPTINPMECLEACDYVCIGEGDLVLPAIADCLDEGRSFEHVKNLAYIRNGEPVVNEKFRLVKELDTLPWRDNTSTNKYLIEDGTLTRNHDGHNDSAYGVYKTMSSRGCPNRCSYCCESTLKDIYAGEVFLRRRSPEDVVAELAEYKANFPLTQVHFDDEIFAMNLKWLEKFATLYREQVGVPFVAYIYPTRSSEKILTLLASAGLVYACLALESGSERINREVFERVYNRELFVHTAGVCKNLGIEFYTDIITYNPYETEADLRDTLDVLLELDGGYAICVNKLFILPGTKMDTRMKADNMAATADDPGRERLFDYYSRLFWMTSYRSRGRAMVNLIQGVPFFKRHPRLVNPEMLEFLVSPAAATRSVLMQRLPDGVTSRLRGWRRRKQAAAHIQRSGTA